jgi:hypothetical protein
VTTTETGLAEWLTEHGHAVVRPDATAVEVADAIASAIDRAGQRRGSLAELPSTDQRTVADRWMLTGELEAPSVSRTEPA